MRLLLDTHIVLWWFSRSSELTEKTLSLIIDHEVFVSAVTPWEIVLKKGKGKLKSPDDFLFMMQKHAFKHLSIDVHHALAVQDLPLLHHDPFDRLLVAQAKLEDLTLLTHDKRLASYGPFVMVV